MEYVYGALAWPKTLMTEISEQNYIGAGLGVAAALYFVGVPDLDQELMGIATQYLYIGGTVVAGQVVGELIINKAGGKQMVGSTGSY